MKLYGKELEKDGGGTVHIETEDTEDLWHLYNLILPGDKMKCRTQRKVQSENAATGVTTSVKKVITVILDVQTVDFDTQVGQLRIKGTNTLESENIKMGASHTAEIEVHMKLSIMKECWDAVFLDRLQECTDVSAKADVAAVIMQEGIAHLCLVTPNMTIVKQRIEVNIPRKRKCGSSSHDKGLQRFYEQILLALERNIRWDVVKAVILASPGFTKDQLFKYIMEEAVKREMKELQEHKAKFVLSRSSSGFKHSLKEVMVDPAVASKLSDTKAAGEVKALDNFYDMMNEDPDRAVYGPDHCIGAAEKDAIDVLMVTDSLFRSQSLTERKKYVALVEKVKETNGDVKIFSSLHVSGERLRLLTGVAAILRFPCPELDEDDEDD
eukprot:CAMPEP_0174312610 /NCGR_PEP_ID=MMETSP0810-20121108/4398_1 /TAXON_ID=73025 ORGANISM="Eutreptiella gymnastica-like, Strain CCMP1594" /NCGR_SAMPLE_ID=MMETSP0810 /ASSEMBLY_ACC=CAM_ASM_000659 /LENGTH=381 /DNA_ID=CAMNT_0015421047 /DNA_START=41 /DNA_END=1186 /DNA_ORIENTATION=-